MATIGVLALQGDVAEHVLMLERLGALAVLVRLPEHLSGLDGLIIPGGESTTIGKLLVAYGLHAPLRARAHEGFPIWGTCAGMILLANRIAEETAMAGQPVIGAMAITVRRNGFGRQVDSFEADLTIPRLGAVPFRAVFIRAPYIESVGAGVEVFARLPDGRIVGARERHLFATAFHPELTGDGRCHQYFLDIVRGQDLANKEQVQVAGDRLRGAATGKL